MQAILHFYQPQENELIPSIKSWLSNQCKENLRPYIVHTKCTQLAYVFMCTVIIKTGMNIKHV